MSFQDGQALPFVEVQQSPVQPVYRGQGTGRVWDRVRQRVRLCPAAGRVQPDPQRQLLSGSALVPLQGRPPLPLLLSKLVRLARLLHRSRQELVRIPRALPANEQNIPTSRQGSLSFCSFFSTFLSKRIFSA